MGKAIAQENFNQATVSLVNGKYTIPFNGNRTELVLINDGTSDLTFICGGFSNFKLAPGEVFDEELSPFTRIEITASSTFRGYVRDSVWG